MSLARMVLSGFLVAGGLILAAFALHGYLDPHWTQKQLEAASLRERAAEPKAIYTFRGRNRFVASRGEQPAPKANPHIVKASTNGSAIADVRGPDAKATTKPQVNAGKKKLAEKAKRPQQASAGWPWNLFSN